MEVERLQAVLEASGLGTFQSAMAQADRVTAQTKASLAGMGAASAEATAATNKLGGASLYAADAHRKQSVALKDAEREARGGIASFTGLGRAMFFASNAFLGGALIGGTLKSIVDKTRTTELAMGQLENAVKNTHQAWNASIDETLKKQGDLSQFTKSDLAGAMTRFVLSTGDVTKAETELSVATNLARTRNEDLATATQQVIMAGLGHSTVLRGLGVAIPKVTTATDALKNELANLKAAHEALTPSELAHANAIAKASDQAATGALALEVLKQKVANGDASFSASSAGGLARFHRSLEELQVAIGTVLLPDITQVIDELSAWMDKLNQTGQAQRDARDAAHALHDAFDLVKGIVNAVDQATGGFKQTLEALLALKAGSIILGWARALQAMAGAEGVAAVTAAVSDAQASMVAWKEVGGGALLAVKTDVAAVGGASAVAAGEVAGLQAGLLGLTGAGLLAGLGALAAKLAQVSKLAQYGFGGVSDQITPTQKNIIGLMTGNGAKDLGGGNLAWKGGYYHVDQSGTLNKLPGPPGATGPGNSGNAASGSPNRFAYQGGAGGSLASTDIQSLLLSAGASPREAAFLTAISGREDPSGRVNALNNNPGTGDYSVGLFQVNYFKKLMAERTAKYGSPEALMADPTLQAKAALDILRTSGPGAWSTNTPAIQALLSGGGGGGAGSAAAFAAANARPKPVKPTIIHGSALVPDSLLDRLASQQSQFKADTSFEGVLTGAAADAYRTTLRNDLAAQTKTLQAEAASLKEKLETAKGKQATAIQTELDHVNGQITSVNQLIVDNLKNQVTALQSKVRTIFSSVQSEMDTALGNLYFQNGLKTPSEALLASMQAADTSSSLQDTLSAAKATFAADSGVLAKRVLDVATGQITNVYDPLNAQKLAADQKAIDQAQRMIDENTLSIKAAQERASADTNYATQVGMLNKALADLEIRIENGTGSMADLQSIAAKFGIVIDGVTVPSFTDLSSAAKTLKDALGDLATYIGKITGVTPQVPATPPPAGGSISAAVQRAIANIQAGNGYEGDLRALAQATHTPIPMADGGMGRVTRPTLFLAGENGVEDYAFSGGGRSFAGGGGGGGGSVAVYINVNALDPAAVNWDAVGAQAANAIHKHLLIKRQATGALGLS